MNCGTIAGHGAHRRASETPCNDCRIAQKEYLKSRRHLYRGRYKKYNTEYSKANPEKNRDRVRRWRATNPESYKEATMRHHNARRARKAQVESEYYTEQLVLETHGHLCHICGTEVDLTAPRICGVEGWENGLHLDHVIPISAGGSDVLSNVKPAHGKCNLTKPRTLFTLTAC